MRGKNEKSQHAKAIKGIERKKTRKIKIGKITGGGNAPIVVQSMLKTNPENFQETLTQARELKNAGCELIGTALPMKTHARYYLFFGGD